MGILIAVCDECGRNIAEPGETEYCATCKKHLARIAGLREKLRDARHECGFANERIAELEAENAELRGRDFAHSNAWWCWCGTKNLAESMCCVACSRQNTLQRTKGGEYERDRE